MPTEPEPRDDAVAAKLAAIVEHDPIVRRRQMRALLRALNIAGESA